MDNHELVRLGGDRSYPAARYVTSQQDHFDQSSVNTWQQAYFTNDTFWVPGSGAPVFLCVGGEGPALHGDAVVDSVHCSNAAGWLREKGALMFALEHRYYGCHNMSACPVPDFGDATSSLKFLSSRQAVEDVANFVRKMNEEYGLTAQNKWVTWGGSYPGMVAGWSRLKHPELIHASVASSAPVLAQVDMPEYNNRVAAAYSVSNNGVGGSESCTAAIRKGHEMIGVMFETDDGQRELEQQFGLRSGSLASRSAQESFAGFGVANFPSQSNDLTCTWPACNIAKICEIMIDESLGDELARLAVLNSARRGEDRNDDIDDEGKTMGLPDFWGYQTCREFGFYQTCETNSSCMFTRGLVTLDRFTSGCQRYGISPAQIEANVKDTNAHYGGLRPSGPDGNLGTCVVWPNGEVDPWAGLSVMEAPSEDQPVLYVEGASHHAWTHASLDSDQDSVVTARLAIRKQVEAFLPRGCSEVPGVVV